MQFLFNYILLFDTDFGQLLTLYNIKCFIFVVFDIGDEASENNHDKDMKNLVGCIGNMVEDPNIKNDKNKALENLISNKHVSINVAIILKTGFIDKVMQIII